MSGLAVGEPSRFSSLYLYIADRACFSEIDPSLPLERKKYIVQDSAAVLVLLAREEKLTEALDFDLPRSDLVISDSQTANNAQNSKTSDLVGHVRPVILSDDIDLDVLLRNSAEPQNGNFTMSELDRVDGEEARLNDAAYLIYTSGLHFQWS